MSTDSRNRVALITGGTRGIGLGIARALAREGFDLSLCGIRPLEAVRAVIDELSRTGVSVQYVPADVSQAGDRERLLAATRERFGRLNLLVNNAGLAPSVRADVLEATAESFERIIGTNLRGPFFLTQAAAGWLIEQKQQSRGHAAAIVFITSVSATLASLNRGDYCISKAGLAMAAQLWAARLAELDIPVYDVRPGLIATDMTYSVRASYDSLIQSGVVAQRRWGTPDDVARVVAALARGDLAYSTGAVIPVDGGLTLPRL